MDGSVLVQALLAGGGLVFVREVGVAVYRWHQGRTPDARAAASLGEAHKLIVTAGVANEELRKDNERLRAWMAEQRSHFEHRIEDLEKDLAEARQEIRTLQETLRQTGTPGS